MKKVQNQDINYRTLSKNEAYILDQLKSEDLITFGVDEIKVLSDWKKSRIHNTVSSLEKKGHIVRIKRNTYSLEYNFLNNTFEVITDAVKPSYISLWTALSYYGFTDQQVNMIQLVSTKQYKDLTIRDKNVEISTLKPKRFFGYIEQEGIIIANKEKSLVDSLFMLDKCGGFDEYIKCLKNAYDELDKNRLKRYLIKFDNKSLISRMGFILDILDLADNKLLKDLNKNKSQSYVLLDPKGNSVRSHNSDWNIKVNREVGV